MLVTLLLRRERSDAAPIEFIFVDGDGDGDGDIAPANMALSPVLSPVQKTDVCLLVSLFVSLFVCFFRIDGSS
jgi:hypothetical protein